MISMYIDTNQDFFEIVGQERVKPKFWIFLKVLWLILLFMLKFDTISEISLPSIFLHLIITILQFEISSLMNLIFNLFQTWILQAAAGKKIQFKLGKNPVDLTGYFKLENCKNQVQINRGLGTFGGKFPSCIIILWDCLCLCINCDTKAIRNIT
jgi:hypothetical protein